MKAPQAFARWAVPVFLFAPACAEVEETTRSTCALDGPFHAVADSAGVRVVENYCPSMDLGWTVGDSALLQVGSVDGVPAEEFSGVTVLLALRLSDGRIVVLDRTTRDLRYFLPTGAHIRSVGRVGDGPGEFRDLTEFLFPLPGDSVAVYDFTLDRLTIFDEEGDLASVVSVRLPRQSSSIYALGRTGDGLLLVKTLADLRSQAPAEGVYPMIESLWRAGADGEGAEHILDYSGQLYYITPGIGDTYLPFSEAPHLGIWEDGLGVVDRGTFTVRKYDFDGNLLLIARRSFTPRPVLSSELNNRHQAQIESLRRVYLDASIPRYDRMFANPEIPKTHAAIDPVIVDRVGNLWVGVNEPEPGPGGTWRRKQISRVWSVFDPDGAWITDVRMPEGLRVTDIGDDYVLGVVRTEFDVGVVRLHSLSK